MRTTLALSVALVLAGCGAPEREPADSPDKVQLSEAEQGELVALLDDYADQYGCVDDLLRWAPTMCRAPLVSIRMSEAPDGDAHGRKLYWLFAKDRDAYLAVSKKQDQPVGQLLIKESWVAASGDANEETPGPYGSGAKRQVPRLRRAVEQDGETWHAGTKHALFVMWKRDPQTPGTDQGWTYATLTPDGGRVTASGRLTNCMQCHADATHDRLFGLPQH